jgi:hypothetical protein
MEEPKIPEEFLEELAKLKVFRRALNEFDPLNLHGNLGKFVNVETGAATDALPPGKAFVIVAGLWEFVKRNPGAMQAKCANCGDLVGLAPRSQELLRENPERPILCIPCGNLLGLL